MIPAAFACAAALAVGAVAYAAEEAAPEPLRPYRIVDDAIPEGPKLIVHRIFSGDWRGFGGGLALLGCE